jgi:hypothetical protein
MITEQEAIEVVQAFDKLDATTQERARVKLGEYVEGQRAQGLPMFPGEQRKAEERRLSTRRLFTENDHGLAEEKRLELDTALRSSMDPRAARFEVFNDRLLSERVTGYKPGQMNGSRRALMQAVAEKEMAWGEKEITDEQFFNLAQRRFLMEDRAAEAGASAALVTNDPLRGIVDLQGKSEGSLSHVEEEIFTRSFEAVSKHLQPHRSMMTRLLSAMESGDEKGMAEAREAIIDLPESERDAVLRALVVQGRAKGEKVDKSGVSGWLEQAGESGARFLLGGLHDSATAESILRNTPDAGKINTDLPDIQTAEDARRYLFEQFDSQRREQRADGADVSSTFVVRANTIELTPKQAELIKQAKERAEREIAVSRELRAIEESTDPVKSLTASALGSTVAALGVGVVTRGAGIPAMARAYKNLEYDKLRLEYRDMSHEDADAIASLAGGAESLLDLVGFQALNKLPGLKGLLSGGLTKTLAARFAKRAGVHQVTQTGAEIAQEYAAPLIQDALAAVKQDIPGHDWEKERPFLEIAGDNFLAMLPLTFLGVGFATVHEYAGARDMLANNETLGLWGAIEEDRIRIVDLAAQGRMDEAQAALQVAQGRRSPEVAQQFAQTAGAAADYQQVVDSVGARVSRGADGWKVTAEDGTSVKVASAEAARLLREKLGLAATEQEAESLVSVLDDWQDSQPAGVKREVELTGENVETKGNKLFATRGAGEIREITGGAMLESVRAQTVAMGGQAVDVVVNGSNEVFRENVGAAAEAVVQRLTINNSAQQAPIVTVLHEILEANLKASAITGTIGKNDAINALAHVANVLPVEPAQKRVESLKRRGAEADHIAEAEADLALRERLHGLVEGKGNPAQLREVAVELAVADVLERDRSGRRTSFRAGAITRALDEAATSAVSAADITALGKVRAFLRSVRAWLRGVLGTVARLKRAKAEGALKDGDALGSFVDKLLGLQESKHAREVTKQAEAMAGAPLAPETSHSLSPARRIEAVSERLNALVDAAPEGSRKFLQKATENLRTLRNRWVDLPEKIGKVELDKMQARIAELKRSEVEEELVARVEHEMGSIAHMPELAKLTEHPLADFLRTGSSRRKRFYAWNLQHPSKWRAAQMERLKVTGESIPGDYDGADGLPSIWFQGNAKPDQVAQEAFDNGLISGPTPDDLWTGIYKMLTEVATNKERLRIVQERMHEAREQARKEGKLEGQAWRHEQDLAQARLGSPRDAAGRDLAALEAMMMALPREVREKLPSGFASMTGLATDSAFAKEMQKRIRQMDKALMAHWKKKNAENLETLLKRGQGKREGGDIPLGVAGAAVHEYFEYVAKVAPMKDADLVGERAKIDAGMEAAAGSEEEVVWLMRQQILDEWGGFESLHPAAQAEALDMGWELYQGGRREWLRSEGVRLQAQRENSGAIVERLGQGLYTKLGKPQSAKRSAGQIEVEFRDFEGVLRALLGESHPLTVRWSREVSRGFAAKGDALVALRRRWQGALDSALPGRSRSQQRRRLYEMRTKRTISVQVEEDKADPRRSTEQKKRDAEAGVFPPKVKNTVKLTEDEAIFLTMTARQSQYVQPLAMAGWTPPVLAEVEAGISDEGKALRQFMAKEYDEGHKGLGDVFARVRGIKLPKIPNYSPGRFYSWSNEKPLDVMGTGTVSGGFASGFLVDRKAHFAQVKLASALGVFWTHQNESLHWQNLAEIVREMRGSFRNPDVKRAIEGAWGDRGNQLLESWMQAIEGNGIRHNAGSFEGLINFAMTNFAVGRLAYNAGTIIKQGMAVFSTSLDNVPFGVWLAGAGEIFRHPSRFLDVYHSPVIQRRLEGGFSPEVRMLLDSFWTSKPGFAQGAMEKGMEFIGFADALFTSLSAAAAYEAHAKLAERAGMTPEQAHIIGMEKMAEAVERTAQPQQAHRRSIVEHRTAGSGKLLIMFMTEARQKASIWVEAWRNVRGGRATANDIKNLVLSHLILAPFLQVLTSAIKDWRDGPDDGEDDPAWELSDFVVSAIIGPLQGLPLLGQIGGGLMDVLAGRPHMDKSSNVLADPITAAGAGIYDLATDLFDSKSQTATEEAEKVLRIMQNVGGPAGVGANVILQGADAAEQIRGPQ